ncbi:hypothetical protein ACN93_14350 [Gordonia paraffinivorans]|uniref:3,4-dihydroxy-2-butanone-4-phosphate synthase n=1 Tax=Gordonia paraffinivorans TaxID=175628 RepID=UPI000D613025|nr:3,4-dihydroxy-2-butanone-4-phosphate synthase [Gordonia paraffinivorans]PWD42321.1 hypothetical protein ACN93_14350 [Gordonia paraffinivorans]
MTPDAACSVAKYGAMRVRRAVRALASGSPVVVVDDRDPSRVYGNLVLAAGCANSANSAFMVRHTSGFLCVALPGAECDRLDLPVMQGVDEFGSPEVPACVTVDAVEGVTTGISASDRARTASMLADAASRPEDFTRPGHVVPVRVADAGLLQRDGIGEVATHLIAAAGHRPAALFATLVGDGIGGSDLPHRGELEAFATAHRLQIVTVTDVRDDFFSTGALVERCSVAELPPHQVVGYRRIGASTMHLATVVGSAAGAKDVYLYVHRDPAADPGRSGEARVLLARAEATVAAARKGVIVRLLGDDAMAGLASSALVGAIVDDLGVESVCLLHNDIDDHRALQSRGIEVCNPGAVYETSTWSERLEVGA